MSMVIRVDAENLGKISAIEELNPERRWGELIHPRPYGAKPFIDLQADRSERPSTCDEIKRVFKRLAQEMDRKMHAIELYRYLMMELYSERAWGEPSHLGANPAQIFGLQADRSERLSTYDIIESVYEWFGEENLGKISAIAELNPERRWGELIHPRPYSAKPFFDLHADRSERPSTYDEIKRVFEAQLQFDEENGEKICNLSRELIRRWNLSLTSSYYDNNFGNNVEYGRHNMRSRKDGAGPYDDMLGHFIVDIPEAVDDNKRVKLIYNWAGGLMGAVAEQGVAGVLANRIAAAGSDTNNPSAVHFMEIAIVLGLSFKLAAVALKGNKRPNLPIWMGKIGDVLTASAIILSLAMHLPPVMACTAAPLAFLLIAFAVAFA